jgi:hypothetical protein
VVLRARRATFRYVPAVAAFGSRTVAAAAVMPLEVVRTRQMKGSTLNLLQEARAIVSTSGCVSAQGQTKTKPVQRGGGERLQQLLVRDTLVRRR